MHTPPNPDNPYVEAYEALLTAREAFEKLPFDYEQCNQLASLTDVEDYLVRHMAKHDPSLVVAEPLLCSEYP
jgi:hypothetical protein